MPEILGEIDKGFLVKSTKMSSTNNGVNGFLEDRYSFKEQLMFNDLNAVFDKLKEPYECSENEINDLMKHDIVTRVHIENTHYPYIAFTIQSDEIIDGIKAGYTTVRRIKPKPQVSIKLK